LNKKKGVSTTRPRRQGHHPPPGFWLALIFMLKFGISLAGLGAEELLRQALAGVH